MDDNIVEDGNLFDSELYSTFREELDHIDIDINDINKFRLEYDKSNDNDITKKDVKEILDHVKIIKKSVKDLLENDLIESVPKEDITPIQKKYSLEKFDDIHKVMEK